MVQDLTHPADLPDEEVRRRLVLERRVVVDRGTWRLARADGSYLRVSASASLVDGTEGAEACLLWHLSDAPQDSVASGGGAGCSRARPASAPSSAPCATSCCAAGATASRPHSCAARCTGCPTCAASHGPEAADRVVTGILDVVRRRLRGTDVVAYVGDHEIAALLAHADMDAAHTTADAIREAAESMRVATAHGVVGTDATVGVASLAGAGSAGPGVRRRRAGDAGAAGRRRAWVASRAGDAGSRRR